MNSARQRVPREYTMVLVVLLLLSSLAAFSALETARPVPVCLRCDFKLFAPASRLAAGRIYDPGISPVDQVPKSESTGQQEPACNHGMHDRAVQQ